MSEDILRISFTDLFKKRVNGSLETKAILYISGERFEPGVIIKKGELLSGVDFNERRGMDVAVVKTGENTYVVRGFFVNE